MTEKESWDSVLDWIANNYEYEQIIEHKALKELLLIKEPRLEEFDTVDDFIKARDLIQFEYMSLVQKLKKDLLIQHKLCLWSSFGQGYFILVPNMQAETAYTQAIKDIKKIFRDTFSIMTNVRDYQDREKQRNEADMISKFSMIQQIVKGAINKRL